MRLSDTQRRGLYWSLLVLLMTVTALAYWPGTRGVFLIDDYPNLVQNHALKTLKPTFGSFLAAALSSNSGPTRRPVAMATFAANVLAAGGGKDIDDDASVMKWTNVGIHLLNGLLIFILLRLLLGRYRRLRPETSERACDWAALAVTAAWLLAPINLTAVLYVIQRMTSLAATFSLLGLIAYLLGRRRLHENGRSVSGWALLLATALVCTPLAVFSKEIGALTLLYALVIEWTLFGLRRADGRRHAGIIVYFSLFLALPAVAALGWLLPDELRAAAWAARPFTLGERLLTEGRVLWHYLWWTLVPDNSALTLFHDAFPVSHGLLRPWSTLPAWAGIGVMLGTGILVRRRYPLIAFGLLWFLAGQVMTATFIPLELVFEHREYLPSLGLYVALFGTLIVLAARHARRRLVAAAVVAIIALYGAALGLRSTDWSNPVRQLAIAARDHPDSPRATYSYGRVLATYAYRHPKLVPVARKALEKAARVPGQGLLPEATLIILALRNGQPVNPDLYYRMARLLAKRPANPGDISGLYSLVHCALLGHDPCKLDPRLMKLVFASALTRPNPSSTIMTMYGNYLLNVSQEPQAARQIFRILVRQYPGHSVYHFDLGITELACGNLEGARRQLKIMHRLNRFGMGNDNIKSLSNLIEQVTRGRDSHG